LLRPDTAERLILPGAIAAPAILALTGFNFSIGVTAVIWFIGAAMSAVQVVAGRVFISAVPRQTRGRAFGIAAACVAVRQGHGGSVLNPSGLPAWWVLFLCLIAFGAPLRFVFRRHPWTLQLTDVPLVLGLFFLSPILLVVVRGTATAVAAIAQRQNPVRFVFN